MPLSTDTPLWPQSTTTIPCPARLITVAATNSAWRKGGASSFFA
jgi:hypothetical protein